MHVRMPRSILWASQGGIAPKESKCNKLLITPISYVSHPNYKQGLDEQQSTEEPGTPCHREGEQVQAVGEEPKGQDHEPMPADEGAGEERENAGTPAGSNRMPRSILWASTGGTSPRTIKSNIMLTHSNFEAERQASQERHTKEEDQHYLHDEEREQDHHLGEEE